jgi:hypothetical protein
MNSYPKAQPLDFELLREDVDSLIRSLVHKVDREFPKQLSHLSGLKEYLLACLLWGENTYRAIRFIAAQAPPDSNRRWSYMLCIPPLNRTILDAIFNLVYLFDDVETRFNWFKKAGWREQFEDRDRYISEYSRFSEWEEYLKTLEKSLADATSLCGITPEERTSPRSIDKWPNPGGMPTFRVKQSQASPGLEFLQYLNDWFYREASQVSHLSFFGFRRIRAVVLKEMLPENLKEVMDADGAERLRSINVGRTLTLILALCSEVEGQFHFELGERLKYAWVLLANHVPETKEIYDKRYAGLLTP